MKLYFYIVFILLITACGNETDLKSAEQNYALKNVSESLSLINKTQLNTIQNEFKNIDKNLILNPLIKIPEGENNLLKRIDSIQNLFNSIINQLNDTSLNYNQLSDRIFTFKNDITQMIGTYTDSKGVNYRFSLKEVAIDFSIKERLEIAFKQTSPLDTALIANIIYELKLPNTFSFSASNKHKLLFVNTLKSKLYKINHYCLTQGYNQLYIPYCGFIQTSPIVISKSQVVQKSETLKFKIAYAVNDSSLIHNNYYKLNGENKKINFTDNNLQIPINDTGITIVKGVVGVGKFGKEISVPWEYKCFKK